MDPARPPPTRSAVLRLAWSALGLVCVGVGAVGVVVPGLPTTIFFIAAAACFTRSSERLERWVLGLPGVGAAVRDHRAGLGMPRRAKVWASASIVVFSAVAIAVAGSNTLRVTIGVAALVGVAWVRWRVPTREQVLARRAAQD